MKAVYESHWSTAREIRAIRESCRVHATPTKPSPIASTKLGDTHTHTHDVSVTHSCCCRSSRTGCLDSLYSLQTPGLSDTCRMHSQFTVEFTSHSSQPFITALLEKVPDTKLKVNTPLFTARCTVLQSAVLLSHVVCPSVCPSVTLVDHDHIG